MKHLNTISKLTLAGVLAGALALAFQPEAHAQRRGGGGARADLNGDGQVTYQELSTARPGITYERYQELDANGDGVLTEADRPEGGRGGEGLGAPQGPGREGRGERGGPNAEGRRPGPGMLREKLIEADVNGDKTVTFEELQAVLPNLTAEHFARMDRNEDGVLTKDDRPEPEGPIGHLMHTVMDADVNEDGQVSYEEFVAALPNPHAQLFGWFDQNGDGVLTPEDRPEPREGRGPGRSGGQGQDGPRMRIREADVNGDFQVTFEELQAVYPNLTQERFDRLDRNGDGVLSRDDRPELPGGGEGQHAGRAQGSKRAGAGGNVSLQGNRRTGPRFHD